MSREIRKHKDGLNGDKSIRLTLPRKGEWLDFIPLHYPTVHAWSILRLLDGLSGVKYIPSLVTFDFPSDISPKSTTAIASQAPNSRHEK